MKTVKECIRDTRLSAYERLQTCTKSRRAHKPTIKAISSLQRTYTSGELKSINTSVYGYLTFSLTFTATNIPNLLLPIFEKLERFGILAESWESMEDKTYGHICYFTSVSRTYKGEKFDASIYIYVSPDEKTPGACRKIVVGQNIRTIAEPIYQVVCDGEKS